MKLNDLFKEYFNEYDIPWDSKCWKCKKKKKQHTKLTKLYNINNYLVISIQRYNSETQEFNNLLLEFDKDIELKNFIDIDIFKGKTEYNLKATLNHILSMEFGHYFCYIKINDE